MRLPASPAGVRELTRRLAHAPDWNERVGELTALRLGAEEPDPAAATGGALDPQRTELPAVAGDGADAVGPMVARALGVRAVATRFGVELQLELPAEPAPALRLRTLMTQPELAADLTPHLDAAHAPIRAAVDAAFLEREFAWFRER
ncbi:MAG: hypothetical protein FJ293_10765 [Planctomycetes bacterium]|nr:hypothetical protein [Planctomycetota bacterium]